MVTRPADDRGAAGQRTWADKHADERRHDYAAWLRQKTEADERADELVRGIVAAAGHKRRRPRRTGRRQTDPWRHLRLTDNRAVAVTWCEQGWEIIPLHPASKTPAIPSPHPWGSPERGTCRGECGQLGHGFHDANSDPGWADWYWTAYPADGIAVRPPVGMAVFDLDPRHGGDVALAAMEEQHSKLPETMTTISGRGDGGHHRWFDNVGGPLRRKLCEGVDILCHERNAVVVPPSLHPDTGEPYTFGNLADAADAPAWLVESATRPEPPPEPPRPPRHTRPGSWRLSPAQALHRCRGLIATVTDSLEGERHDVLLWAACRAAGDGFLLEEDDPVWCALTDAAEGAGLRPDEIRRVLLDAVAIAGGDG